MDIIGIIFLFLVFVIVTGVIRFAIFLYRFENTNCRGGRKHCERLPDGHCARCHDAYYPS